MKSKVVSGSSSSARTLKPYKGRGSLSDVVHNVSTTFPNEILRHIFIDVLLNGEGIDIGAEDGDIWRLSEVSMRWKAVIQDTPRLWSTFAISERAEVDEQTLPSRIKACLELSKTAHLSISLFPMSYFQILHAVLEEILRHGDHLEILSMNTLAAQKLYTLPNVAEARCNHLREFSIKGGQRFLFHPFPFEILQDAQKLENVTLTSISLSGVAKGHWQYLKKLTIDQLEGSFQDFRAVLEDCRVLDELTFGMTTASADMVPSDESILLPSLRTLKICCASPDIVDRLCAFMRIPNLTNLEVENDFLRAENLLNAIERSRSSVKSLHLDTAGCIRFIDRLPDIQHLTLSGERLREFMEVLPRLVWNPRQNTSTPENILPNLETLVLHLCPQTVSQVMASKLLPDVMRSRSSVRASDSHPAPITMSALTITCSAARSANISSFLYEISDLGRELEMIVNAEYTDTAE